MPRLPGEGFISSARIILRRSKTPLTCTEIVERAIEAGLLETTGRTPQNTLHAMLMRHIYRRGDASGFRKVGRGRFELVRLQHKVRHHGPQGRSPGRPITVRDR